MLTKTKNLREKLTTSKSVNFLLTVYFLVSLIINPTYLQINRFTTMNTLEAKRISIRQFLMAQQIAPVKENKHSGIYLSPLRSETQPSFKVDYIQNLWFDHGQGGSIIDQSPNYANHKDLNDYLCHFKKRQEQNSRLNPLVKPRLR